MGGTEGEREGGKMGKVGRKKREREKEEDPKQSVSLHWDGGWGSATFFALEVCQCVHK